MRFGSVCSGIEAASVAWHPLGWKAAWLSEIEPFPSAVLNHHYPDVPNLGDMTTLPERILSGEVEAPDVFCGGTPCQAFSVAGLRKSLDDARGNLSLTFVGIANAIDHVRSVRSANPAIIFWENVPGVLNTKDNAFGCFLAALAGEDDALVPSGGKWTNAGCVFGPQRTVAWRVLDAQYFGVAQRRRRVFVVASARADFNPAAVLFEFEGVRRDTAPSREKGQRVAPSTGASASVGSWPAEVSSTLDTTFGTKMGLENQHVNAGCPLFVPVQTFSIPAIGHIVKDDLASTMTRHTGSGSGETQNPAFAMQPINIYGGNKRTGGTAVMQPIAFDAYNNSITGDVSKTLDVGQDHHHVPLIMQPIAFAQNTRDEVRLMNGDGQIVGALAAEPGMKQTCYIAQPAYTTKLHNTTSNQSGKVYEEYSTSLDRSSPPPALLTAMQVRRLTPVECERLQGFPDNYTDIKAKGKPTPDGPRYKSLGNSWAVPVVRWIGSRIAQEVQRLESTSPKENP